MQQMMVLLLLKAVLPMILWEDYTTLPVSLVSYDYHTALLVPLGNYDHHAALPAAFVNEDNTLNGTPVSH